MRLTTTLYLILFTCISSAQAGKKLRVLFIGNSYTYVNNMPQIVADIANTMGDTLIWDMAAPGGADLSTHFYDPATRAKIRAGNWDYVALQEQSLVPSMPDALGDGTFIYRRLDSLIRVYNPCAETMYYMTWGRKNGEPDFCRIYSDSPYYWPHHCTYHAMDSVTRLRYRMWTDSTQGVLSPAGAVWHYIRDNYPAIELYDADESHPSPSGSYAAACCFYTALFRKDPSLITYNFSLGATDAANIRTAVKKVTYDSMLYWHLGQYRTEAYFTQSISGTTVSFTNTSANAAAQTWYFGDGLTAGTANPVHTYAAPGNYLVMLVAMDSTGSCPDTAYSVVTAGSTGIPNTDEAEFKLSPNPAGNFLYIHSATFLSGTYRISLFNDLGQKIQEHPSLLTTQQVIDLSAYSSGLYFLSISKDGDMLYRGKVLKQ